MENRRLSYRDMPIGLDGLIAWLEEQDPATKYNYSACGDCLLYRYFSGAGIDMPEGYGIGGEAYYAADLVSRDLPYGLNDIAQGFPRSYGGALERAKALKAIERRHILEMTYDGPIPRGVS